MEVYLLLIALHSAIFSASQAQSVLVICSIPGSTDCSLSNSPFPVPYATCCSMVNADERYYFLVNGSRLNCRKCGPILDADKVFPIASTANAVIISWSLSAVNFIDPIGIQVGAREEFSTGAVHPITISSGESSVAFLELTEGVRYTYLVRALSRMNGMSPTIEYSWVTGRNLGPTIGRFVVTSVNSTEVTAEWVLEFHGVLPLSSLILTWRDGGMSSNASTTEALFLNESQPVAEGSVFSFTFTSLVPGTRYSLQINASNDMHTTTIFFAFETNKSAEISTVTANAGGLLSRAVGMTVLLPIHHLFLLLLIIQQLFWT